MSQSNYGKFTCAWHFIIEGMNYRESRRKNLQHSLHSLVAIVDCQKVVCAMHTVREPEHPPCAPEASLRMRRNPRASTATAGRSHLLLTHGVPNTYNQNVADPPGTIITTHSLIIQSGEVVLLLIPLEQQYRLRDAYFRESTIEKPIRIVLVTHLRFLFQILKNR